MCEAKKVHARTQPHTRSLCLLPFSSACPFRFYAGTFVSVYITLSPAPSSADSCAAPAAVHLTQHLAHLPAPHADNQSGRSLLRPQRVSQTQSRAGSPCLPSHTTVVLYLLRSTKTTKSASKLHGIPVQTQRDLMRLLAGGGILIFY